MNVDKSSEFWHLDKLNILDDSSLIWRWSYTIYSYDFNSNYWQFEEKSPACAIQGSSSDNFFIVDEEGGDPNTIESGSSLPPSEMPFKLTAKRHFNGILLVDQWWPNIKNAVLEVLISRVTSITKEPYNCLIFQGVQTPAPYPISPLWIRACLELSRIDLFLELMSQHKGF